MRPTASSLVALVLCTAIAPLVSPVHAAPLLGFRETWDSGFTQGWSGSALLLITNPGGGGLASSGFLRVAAEPPDRNVGTRSFGPEYTGSWTTAGISQVRVWLSNLGTDDALEIHLSLGRLQSLFQYDIGFVPPVNGWAEYVIDLTNPANFTRVIAIGTGTFAGALDSVEVVHLRHDLAPFSQSPDLASGDFGIDGLLLTNGVLDVGAPPAAVHRPVMLAAPSPNPSRGPVRLAVSSAAPTDVTIRIVDAMGRRVREQLLAGVTGARSWVWDGRDQDGRRVASGAYRVVASSPLGGTSRSLVFLD